MTTSDTCLLTAALLLALPLLLVIARLRTRACAEETPTSAERAVLASAWTAPRTWPVVSDLVPADFDLLGAGQAWQALTAVGSRYLDVAHPARKDGRDEHDEEPDVLGNLTLEQAQDCLPDAEVWQGAVRAELASWAERTQAAEAEECLALLAGTPAEHDPRTLTRLGWQILDASSSRSDYPGLLGFEPTGRQDVGYPQQRRARARIRSWWWPGGAAALVAAGLSASRLAACQPGPSRAVWLGALALLVMICGGLVLALVDMETLYIDKLTNGVTTALAWGLGVWAQLAAHTPLYIVVAVVAVVVVYALVALSVGILTVWRGRRQWLGGGDYKLLPLVVGVPVLVSGDIVLPAVSLFVASLLSLLTWGVGARLKRVDRSTAMPFGPSLIFGFVLATPVVALINSWVY